MTTTNHHHRQIHNLLLLQKILTLRDGSSPFTLVLDTVEQTGKGLVGLLIGNAKISKTKVIFISFETLHPPAGVDVVIRGSIRKGLETLEKEIKAACSHSPKTLLILDTLHPLCTLPASCSSTFSLPQFLSSLLTPPTPTTPTPTTTATTTTTLLATYHLDIPLPISPSSTYQTPALPLLKYLATTILTVHSFPHILAQARAAEKSLPDPVFGLAEEKEGVVLGFPTHGQGTQGGIVVEMEHRRKSGRGVFEKFYFSRLVLSSSTSSITTTTSLSGIPSSKPHHRSVGGSGGEDNDDYKTPILLDDHPLYLLAPNSVAAEGAGTAKEEEGGDSLSTTFDLTLTSKQREDRAGVVLPYFDAQGGGGGQEQVREEEYCMILE